VEGLSDCQQGSLQRHNDTSPVESFQPSLYLLIYGLLILKSDIARGDVFNETMHGIPALLAALTPRSAFYTTTASEGFVFRLCNVTLYELDLAYPFLRIIHLQL